MKTRNCEDCARFKWPEELDRPSCQKGHALRFYRPRWPHDQGWGWKRRCNDYDETPDGLRRWNE